MKQDVNLGRAITPDMVRAGAKFASAFTGRSGARPASGGAGSGATTINPAFQQSFTPQFSPAMQQQQDSPGASQAASPTQRADIGQRASPVTGRYARGPEEMPTPMGVRPVGYRSAYTDSYSPAFQDSNNYNSLIIAGIIGVSAVTIAVILGKSKRKGGRK